MRNLKRALSLTLASVMLLGMMVIGTSAAAGYDDVKETDNVEAIEVLQAVEVMVGDDRGFGPDRPVTRAEMAVVMGKLLNLNYNYYTSTCPFTDVSGNFDWAKGWVGACYANKILSGRGEGIFDPAATVTAVEAASMMMRALGYFQYTEDVADGFVLATVRQGNQIGIFDGVGTDGSTPMTRNQVAQMALNALRSEVVDFTGTPGIEVNGVKVGYKAEYTSRTSTEAKYNAIEGRTSDVASDYNHKGQYYVQLGEELYNGDLRLSDNRVDAFGRPSRYWEYNGKEIGTYMKKELIQAEYTKKVTGKDLYELIGKGTIEDKEYDFYISVDGETEKDVLNSVALPKKDEYFFDRTNLLRTNTNQVGGTGNGVLTQVFVDNDKKDVYISIINTYLAVADYDYNAKKDMVRFTVWNLEEYNNNSDKLVKDSRTNTSLDVSGEDFDIKDVKDGDIVKVTVAEGEIKTIDDVEVMDDVTITSFKNGSYLVTGGTQYDYNTTARYDNDALNQYVKENGNMKDVTYRVYLDQYGFVIGVEIIDATVNYLFLTGINSDTTNLSDITARGNVIFTDGTLKTVDINMTKSENAEGNRFTDGDDNHAYTGAGTTGDPYTSSGDGTGVSSLMNTWCTYTVNDDGVYTLKEVANNAVTFDSGKAGQSRQFEAIHSSFVNKKYSEHTGANAQTANAKLFEINKTHVRLNGITDTTFKTVYGNDKSIYLSAETSIITARKALNGVDSADVPAVIISGVDGVSTGVQQTNIDVRNAMAVVAAGGQKYINRDPILEDVSSGAYTLFDKNGYVIAAVVLGDDQGTSTRYAWVVDDEVTNEGFENGKWSWHRGVIVDGKLIELNESNDDNSNPEIRKDLDLHQGVRWWEVKSYADGSVKDVTSLAPAAFTGSNSTKYVNDIKWVEDNTNNTVVLLQNLTGAANKVRVTGNTLHIETNQTGYAEGFAVSYDANIAVVQDEEILRNGQSLTPREYNYKEIVEEFTNNSDADGLKDAVKALNDNDNFKGWLAAVFDSNGVATSVILYDLTETKVNTSTDINLGSDLSVTEFPEGTLKVTSTRRLTAREVGDAIRAFLNDDDVVKVEYTPATGKAVVTYEDNTTVTYDVDRSTVASEAEVAGAELVSKIQNLIGETSTTGTAVEIEGNTIVTKPADDTASTAYVNAAGGDGTSDATKDLVAFLVKLYENGASSIKFGDDTYEWNTGIRFASKWLKTDGDGVNGTTHEPNTAGDTLAKAIETALTAQITDGGFTTGTKRVSATIVVDGAEMIIAIDFKKA